MQIGVVERLLSKCIHVPESGCWLWLAKTERGGYGMFWHEGKSVLAHRLSYKLFIGSIPEGKQMDHLCRVRCCVNPHHLEPVTARINVHRSNNLAAANVVKTHCIKGHEFNAENTYITFRKNRACRECLRIAGRNYRRKLALLNRIGRGM